MALFSRFFFVFIFVCTSFLSTAHANTPVLLPVHPERLKIMSSDGAFVTSFDVEIAATPEQRATGLMHRKGFGGNSAMLFDFNESKHIAMWMKNTPSPLDMLFVGIDGEILAIATDTTPFSLTVIAPNVISAYVVEIGAGESNIRGVQVGQFIRHVTLKAPVK